jgi:DNA-binding beta-propeller fold protein YncE
VSKSSDQPEAAPAAESTPAPQPQQPQRQQIHVDDSKAIASYANFCRVTGTPEELIVDFGLNPQPFGVPQEPVAVTQRIVTNYYTAKRMLHALTLTVQRHEQAFGVLETDVQKRVIPSVRAQMAAAAGQK